MQAATVNDTYTISLVQADGTTPYSTTGWNSASVIIKPPGGGTAVTISNPTLTVNVNSLVFKTTATTFPTGGVYWLQASVGYPDGTLSKSRPFSVIITTF